MSGICMSSSLDRAQYCCGGAGARLPAGPGPQVASAHDPNGPSLQPAGMQLLVVPLAHMINTMTHCAFPALDLPSKALLSNC